MLIDKKFNPVTRRANEQCKETIANILLFDVSDPRLRMVTITGCDVSPDKRNAKVFFTTDKNKYQETEECLTSAKKYIRKLLGDRLGWRVVPEIHFYVDPSVDMGDVITKALEKEGRDIN